MNGRESRLKENMVYLFRVFGKWNKSKCYTKASYNSSSCGIVTFCEANYSKIAWHSVVFPSFLFCDIYLFTPQPLRLRGIVVPRAGGRAGGRADKPR